MSFRLGQEQRHVRYPLGAALTLSQLEGDPHPHLALLREHEQVSVSIAAANRDPATFPHPDRFDVRRVDTRRHVAFARGPHVCIGMHLARLEAHAAVGGVLARLPGLRLDGSLDETAPRGLVFRKPPVLPVRWG